jgi:hypothetical protein
VFSKIDIIKVRIEVLHFFSLDPGIVEQRTISPFDEELLVTTPARGNNLVIKDLLNMITGWKRYRKESLGYRGRFDTCGCIYRTWISSEILHIEDRNDGQCRWKFQVVSIGTETLEDLKRTSTTMMQLMKSTSRKMLWT